MAMVPWRMVVLVGGVGVAVGSALYGSAWLAWLKETMAAGEESVKEVLEAGGKSLKDALDVKGAAQALGQSIVNGGLIDKGAAAELKEGLKDGLTGHGLGLGVGIAVAGSKIGAGIGFGGVGIGLGTGVGLMGIGNAIKKLGEKLVPSARRASFALARMAPKKKMKRTVVLKMMKKKKVTGKDGSDEGGRGIQSEELAMESDGGGRGHGHGLGSESEEGEDSLVHSQEATEPEESG